MNLIEAVLPVYKKYTSKKRIADVVAYAKQSLEEGKNFNLFFEIGETEHKVIFVNLFTSPDYKDGQEEGLILNTETAVLFKEKLSIINNCIYLWEDMEILDDLEELEPLKDKPVWTGQELLEITKHKFKEVPSRLYSMMGWRDFL